MIFIIRALSQWGNDDEDYDSNTSRDDTLDFTKRKKREKGQKEKKKCPKKEGENKKGNATISFSTLVLQSSTLIFMIESLLCCHFHILVGIFHYRTWLVYSDDGLPQMPEVFMSKQVGHTHLIFSLSFHTPIALVHLLHGNPYSLHWHQLMGISLAHWLAASMWDFLLFCLLHNHHSIPHIVLYLAHAHVLHESLWVWNF